MNEFALKINHISKSYKDGNSEYQALNDVSLQVKHGEFVAIVGPSGSGKTTLLSIAGALLTPSEGTVEIGTTQILENKKNWGEIRRNQIGFIFQSHQLLPYLNVADQLSFISRMNKRNNTEERQYRDTLLEDLGLTSKANSFPRQLSGGEKQRVAIARAFMNKPDIILADEPTASLDGIRGRQVVEKIKEEVRKYNKAAVMVTHDERILGLVDTIYHIENGMLTKK